MTTPPSPPPTDRPLLSIVSVTFRDPAGLARTADSLPDPLDPRVEWLVVDGGSGEAVEAMLRADGRARWSSEPDDGLYDAMNKGAARAHGRWVQFLNGGDLLADGALDVLLPRLSALSRAGAGPDPVLVGHTRYALPGGRRVLRRSRPRWYALYGMPAIHQSILFPGAALPSTPYPAGFDICGDYALVAHCYRAGVPFERVDAVLTEFATGGRSYENPRQLLQEAARVQREILRLPRVAVIASAALRSAAAVRLRVHHAGGIGVERARSRSRRR